MLVGYRPPLVVRQQQKVRDDLKALRTDLAPHSDQVYQKATRKFLTLHSDPPGGERGGRKKKKVLSRSVTVDTVTITEGLLVKWMRKECMERSYRSLCQKEKEAASDMKEQREQLHEQQKRQIERRRKRMAVETLRRGEGEGGHDLPKRLRR